MKKFLPLITLFMMNVPLVSAQDYLIPAKENGFWGYLDQERQWIVPARFEDAMPFVQGLGCVKYYGKWGYIDKTGEWQIEPQFDKAKPFSEQVASVKLHGRWGYINRLGNWVIDPKYQAVSSFSEGLAVIYDDGGFTYIDKEGRQIFDHRFTFAKPFTEGLASVILDGNRGYIDFSGRFIINHQYDKADAFSEGFALVSQHKKYGYINQRGDVMIPLKFRDANHFSEGKAGVRIDGQWGYIDKTGELVIGAEYEYAGPFCNGMAVVRKNNRYGMIDEYGYWVIEAGYADMNESGRSVSLEDEIVQLVEQRIRQWERKGEFEKSADYFERVTEENRDQVIKAETKKVINELGWRYVRLENMELGLYNADVEMFTLYIPGMMSTLMPVPIRKAEYFKNNWFMVDFRNPEFAVHNDHFVLSRFEAWLDDSVYDYDAYRHGIYISDFGGKPQLDDIQITLPGLPVPLEYARSIQPPDSKSDVDMNIPYNEIRQDFIFALVIGNEDYSSYQVGLESNVNVDHAENDALIFTEYLRKTLGLPDENITMLINATAGQIKQALAKMTALARAYEGEAEFIFYYAGHGLPDEKTGEPFLMPVDVAPSDLVYAISLQEVYEKFTNYESGKVSIFLDACFSGGARNEAMLAARGIRIRPKSPFVMGNLIVFSASRGDQTAYGYDEEGHGMFTYHLLKKMQETRGMVLFGGLADYLEKEVNRRSLLVNNREQQPVVKVSPILEYTWRDFSFVHQTQVINE
jgi:hypothetical protein